MIKKCDMCYVPLYKHDPYCLKCEWHIRQQKAAYESGNKERRKKESDKFQKMLKHESHDPTPISE